MARSRRKVDIYSQPGLFDFSEEKTYTANEDWEAGRVLYKGGRTVSGGRSEGVIPPVENIDRSLLRFISFGSGSSGNSAYLGTDDYGIIIDAGVNPDKIEEELQRNGIEMRQVVGIILTHDHSDHVGYTYKLLRNNRHLGLFCTPRTLNGLLKRHGLSLRVKDYHKPIYKEIPFKIRELQITAFEVSHDGSDNVGYIIQYRHHNFVVATDMGYINDRAENYMKMATALMIESDYDSEMLRNGRYPEYLKARIMASKGHLDNKQVADFLRKGWTEKLHNIFLCHLSKDNNVPQLAFETAKKALLDAGAEFVGDGSESIESRNAPVQLYPLPRFDTSPLFILR